MNIDLTYSVVKFMVKVKLVEKSVNRTVGRVMVENVTIQYRRPGMTLAVSNSARPSTASHEDCRRPWRAASIGEACATAAFVAELALALALELELELGVGVGVGVGIVAVKLDSDSDPEKSIIWTWTVCSASKHFDILY